MTLKRCDVVQIPFPYSDLSRQKRRPVLLLTDEDGWGDFLAVAITSQPGHADAIALDNADFFKGQLPKPCWVRSQRLFSLNRQSVMTTLGSLRPEAFARIHHGICMNLGCIAAA